MGQHSRRPLRIGKSGVSLVFFAFCLGLLSRLLVPPSASSPQEPQYFAETGHAVDPVFADAYLDHGGLEILGYPITEGFQDFVSGRLVQYFQNGRLELLTEPGRADGEVFLSPLGAILSGHASTADQVVSPPDSGCRTFPETGHSLCHSFLEFYEDHGGRNVFGLPITDFRLENGRLVQYFERFRLDWNPDGRTGEQVTLAPLGRIHFESVGYPRDFLDPVPSSMALGGRTFELTAQASMLQPVVGENGPQEVFVLVTDQDQAPVAGAAVMLIAHFPTGDRTLMLPFTDARGASRVQLAFESQPAGTFVELEVWVMVGDTSAMTTDSFLVWW